MARIHTRCPRILSPCPQPPAFAAGVKSLHCDLCQKTVHNLSAMTAAERDALYRTGGSACVRYARWMPLALALATGGAAAGEATDAPADDPQDQLTEVIVGGGMVGEWQSVFLESELESEDEWLDSEPSTE